MDICDMNQYFGCEVLQSFKPPSPIYLEVLALAKASIDACQQCQRVAVNTLTCIQQRKNSSEDNPHQALLDALRIVKTVVTNLSDFWDDRNSVLNTQHVLEPLLSELNRNSGGEDKLLATVTFWLTAKISKCDIIPRY
jgi:hypothetical protein